MSIPSHKERFARVIDLMEDSESEEVRLEHAIELIKLICAPLPENGLRGRAWWRAEHGYFIRQDDALFEILTDYDWSEESFLDIVEKARKHMREGDFKRFESRSAFGNADGTKRWAHRSPRRAAKWVRDRIRALFDLRNKGLARIGSEFVEFGPSQAAHSALSVINLDAAIGVRLAALTELSEQDASISTDDITKLVEGKTTAANSRR